MKRELGTEIQGETPGLPLMTVMPAAHWPVLTMGSQLALFQGRLLSSSKPGRTSSPGQMVTRFHRSC